MPHNEERRKGRRGIYRAAGPPTGRQPRNTGHIKIIVLFGAGISRPEIRAGSALAAAGQGRRTTVTMTTVTDVMPSDSIMISARARDSELETPDRRNDCSGPCRTDGQAVASLAGGATVTET